MTTLKTYSPQEVTMTWAGYGRISDFASGTAIEVSRNEDNSSQEVGMQGTVGLTYNADKTGTVSVTIMQTGESNRLMSAVQNMQDVSGELIRGDIVISDPSGSFICRAASCHIMSTPTVTLGDEQNAKTWVFYAERIDFTDVPVGAAVPAASAARVAAATKGIKSASDALQSIL